MVSLLYSRSVQDIRSADTVRLSYDEEEYSQMATLTKSDIRKLRKKKARLKRKLKCRFCPGGVIPRPVYVDYKDIKSLRQLIDREGKIQPRRRTGTSAIYQRAVRRAVLRARFMGLLPYVVDE